MADVYNLKYFNAVNKAKKKKKVKDTGKQYTNEELARIQTVSRLPAFQQKSYYEIHPKLKARVKERTETAYKLTPGTVGFMEALNPVSTEKTISKAVGKLKLTKPKKTTAYKIGSALGTMAQFASTGGLAQNAVSKGLYKGTSKAGKVLSVAGANAIAGAPVNASLASRDKNPLKSFAVNTGLDIVTGGLMDSPAVVRAIKNLKSKAVTKTTPKSEVVSNVLTEAPIKSQTITPKEVKTVIPAAESKIDVSKVQIPQKEKPEITKNDINLNTDSVIKKTLMPETLTAKDLKPNTGEFKVDTPEGTKVPKFNNTAYPYMTEEVKASVQNELEQGKYLFTNNKLQQLQSQSAKKLESASPEEVDQMYKTFMTSNDLTPQAQADGINLALYYQGLGDVQKATEVGMTTAERFSQIGSAMNTAKLIQKFTPEGRQQIVFNIMNKLQNEKSKLLAGKQLEISPKTLKAVVDAQTEPEINNALRAAGLELWDQIPGSTLEKINAIRRASLLFNPKTWIKNFLANIIFVPVKAIKNVTASGLESVAQKTGLMTERSNSVLNLTNKTDVARMDLGSKAFTESKQSIMENGKWNEGSISSRPYESKTFKNVKLDTFMKVPGKVLEWGDEKVLEPSFVHAYARYLKANGIDPALITKEQADRAFLVAKEEALRGTFRDASKASETILALKKIDKNATPFHVATSLFVESQLPFVKTPINVARRAFDYSPIGVIKGIGRIVAAASKGDKDMMIRGIDNIASGLTGSGIMLIGALMHRQGLLNGRLPYDSEGNFQKLQGEQGYSINVAGGSFTVDWATPAILPLLVGAEIDNKHSSDGYTFDDVVTSITDIATPVVDLSMMSGVADTLQSVQSKDSTAGVLSDVAISSLTGYAGQFVPTISGQLARSIDGTRRSTTSTAEGTIPRALEKWKNKQLAKIPGASKTLQPYVDEWGRTQTTSKTERILENFLSPGFYNKSNVTPVDEEITSLYDNLSDETKNSILPKLKSDYTVTFQSNKERLQPKDMTTYNKTKGKESYKALAKLFRTDEYKTASNEEQSKMVANVFEKSGKLAKIDTLLSKGKDEWKVYTDDFSGGKANYASAKKAGISAKDYYTAFDGADKDDNGSVSQYEAYKKLEKTKFTKEQKAVLWAKFNKSWASKNNPYLGGKIPSSGKSGSSGSSSGSSKKSSSSTSSTTGLATKQVNSLKNLDLTTNTLSKSELKAMIKMLLQ